MAIFLHVAGSRFQVSSVETPRLRDAIQTKLGIGSDDWLHIALADAKGQIAIPLSDKANFVIEDTGI